MFTSNFEKAMENPEVKKAFDRVKHREDQAWDAVNQILSRFERLNKAEDFKRGDTVYYKGETGWKYGEDARHTKGNWDGSDWDKDGIYNGCEGVVVGTKGNDVIVKWLNHHWKEHSRKWVGTYRPYELRKDQFPDSSEYHKNLVQDVLLGRGNVY